VYILHILLVFTLINTVRGGGDRGAEYASPACSHSCACARRLLSTTEICVPRSPHHGAPLAYLVANTPRLFRCGGSQSSTTVTVCGPLAKITGYPSPPAPHPKRDVSEMPVQVAVANRWRRREIHIAVSKIRLGGAPQALEMLPFASLKPDQVRLRVRFGARCPPRGCRDSPSP